MNATATTTYTVTLPADEGFEAALDYASRGYRTETRAATNKPGYVTVSVRL